MVSFEFPGSQILVFAKPPIPGQVKTRLHSVLSQAESALLYERMLQRVWKMAVDSHLCPVELWAASDAGHSFFGRLPGAHRIMQQQGSDLGQRMQSAAGEVLKESGSVLIIGGDCVSLDADYLRRALQVLETGCELVLGPADDGGYVLIGLRTVVLPIFADMPWGSAQVMEMTRQRLQSAAISWDELPLRWDVDRPEDLARLVGTGLLDNIN